jgi:UDP-N-acetylglucosamine 4-epimerase
MKNNGTESEITKSSFLITGGAGFIGSNIVDYLMQYNPKLVRVLDDLSSGFHENISKYLSYSNFQFINGDIRDFDICQRAMVGIDFVSHQAALGSVSRSISNPILTHDVNANGFLNVITAAKEAKVKGFVYASSSSVYGDSLDLPKQENKIGKPLSPYAVSKLTNELYASSFSKVYNFYSVGLRYFNVFGPRQNPNSQYSAVIPLFMKAALLNEAPLIFGDGQQSRDFTYIDNVVNANILSLIHCSKLTNARIYNVAMGETTSLIKLWDLISRLAGSNLKPTFKEARIGDVRDSLANISLAKTEIGYTPGMELLSALDSTLIWYKKNIH